MRRDQPANNLRKLQTCAHVILRARRRPPFVRLSGDFEMAILPTKKIKVSSGTYGPVTIVIDALISGAELQPGQRKTSQHRFVGGCVLIGIGLCPIPQLRRPCEHDAGVK